MAGRGIARIAIGSGCLIAAAAISLFARAQVAEFVTPAPIRSVDQIQAHANEFTFVRVRYTDKRNSRAELIDARGGRTIISGTWAVDYPEADSYFSRQVEQHLGLEVDPDGIILELTDPDLADYPFIYLVEGGQLALIDEEVVALRDYLNGGGFILFDDFWGEADLASLEAELQRVFPGKQPAQLWGDHEIFWSFFPMTEMQTVPGITELMNPSSATTTHQVAIGDTIYRVNVPSDAGSIDLNPDMPAFRGIADDDGRLMVLMLHNMDFGDGWEHIDDPQYPKEFSLGSAVPMGINIVAYALTH